jgi:PhoH-like ATPase
VGVDGGTVRVELNHTNEATLPNGMRLGDNDTRILAVAANLSAEGLDVTVVSKDLRCG